MVGGGTQAHGSGRGRGEAGPERLRSAGQEQGQGPEVRLCPRASTPASRGLGLVETPPNSKRFAITYLTK